MVKRLGDSFRDGAGLGLGQRLGDSTEVRKTKVFVLDGGVHWWQR